MTTVQWWSAWLDDAACWWREGVSDDELVRASRFRVSVVRDRWLLGRAALRRGLGAVLNVDPVHIRFAERSGNSLTLEWPRTPCSFSISRSGRRVVGACADGRPLGIDLEENVAYDDLDEVVYSHFASAERAAYRAAPAEDRVRLFYRSWTAKEAVLKARGVGLAVPLARVADIARGLDLLRPAVGSDYTCAVAVAGRGCRLESIDVL